MSFPKIQNYPVKTITLPISKIKVTYRPFTVGEEKILLMSREAGQLDSVIDNLSEAIRRCCITPVDPKVLPSPDFEYLFLKIRCLSKGETSEPTYRCTKLNKDGNECGTKIKFMVDLDKLEVVTPQEHSNVVQITGTEYFIQFRYPTLQNGKNLVKRSDKTIDSAMGILYESVEKLIHVDGSVFDDFTLEDAQELIDGLTDDQYSEVERKFLTSMPTLRHVLDFNCPTCGHQQKIVLEGLESFFT